MKTFSRPHPPRHARSAGASEPQVLRLTVVIVLICIAFCCSAWGDYATLPANLDFGPASSPVNDVYDKVSASTFFDGKVGWVKPVLFEERDRGGDDDLTRDFVFSAQPATLRIALRDGDYIVTMTCFDKAASHSSFLVRAGEDKVRETPAIGVGEAAEIEIRAKAKNGVLDIEFRPKADIWLVNALTVRALAPGESFAGPRYKLSTSPQWCTLGEARFDSPKVTTLRKVKKPDYHAGNYPDLSDYMRVLERFPLLAERGWHPDYNGLSDVGYFGDGDNGEMGLRSMGNFIFTCALLASDPRYDPSPSGVSREKLLDYARQCLRYMTRSHVTGDLKCGNGGQWGDQWQSSWWTGKMAAGARLIWDRLTPEERGGVERVVVHEADRDLGRTAPGGASRDTKSEENAWDTEAMTWACALFPDHPNAPKWWRKLQEFHMNTLSVSQDEEDSALVDFRPVKEWVSTENVHSDYTIENHGAYHFCYMACPLHSRAWDWYGLTSNGQPVPQSLFSHSTDVWNVIRRMFLYDNQFAYVSGKDWPRYAYGLYFIMPACVLMQEVYGDRDARLFERKRFETFEREQIMNSDGTFFGRRFTGNKMLSRPLEFETDTYANLGACYLMHKMSRKPLLKPSDGGDFQRRVTGTLISKESGWALGRSPKVFTSFSWRELGGSFPMGLFIPAGCDDMADWEREQLAGSFAIEGCDPRRREIVHAEKEFSGGFWTVGRVAYLDQAGSAMLNQHLAFVSMPNEGIALLMDHAVAVTNIKVNSQEGLKLYLANDIFNSGVRKVAGSSGEFTLWGGDKTMKTLPEKAVHVVGDPWISVDGKLSFVALTSNSPFTVRDLRGRSAPWGSLEYEMIDLPYITEPHEFHSDGLVRYSVVVLAAGDGHLAGDISRHSKLIPSGSPDVRCAVVSKDGKHRWLVAVNFGDQPASTSAEVGAQTISFDVQPMSAEIRKLD